MKRDCAYHRNNEPKFGDIVVLSTEVPPNAIWPAKYKFPAIVESYYHTSCCVNLIGHTGFDNLIHYDYLKKIDTAIKCSPEDVDAVNNLLHI